MLDDGANYIYIFYEIIVHLMEYYYLYNELNIVGKYIPSGPFFCRSIHVGYRYQRYISIFFSK